MTTVVHLDASFLRGAGSTSHLLQALHDLVDRDLVIVRVAWVAMEETIHGKAREVEQSLKSKDLYRHLNWLPSVGNELREIRKSAEVRVRQEFERLVAQLKIQVDGPTAAETTAATKHMFAGTGPVTPAGNRDDLPDAFIFESMLANRGPNRNVAFVNDKKFLVALSTAGFEILVTAKGIKIPEGANAHTDFNEALGVEVSEAERLRLVKEVQSWDQLEFKEQLREEVTGADVSHSRFGNWDRWGPFATVDEITDEDGYTLDYERATVLTTHILEVPFTARVGCVVDVNWNSDEDTVPYDAFEHVQHYDELSGEAAIWLWTKVIGSIVVNDSWTNSFGDCEFVDTQVVAEE